MRINIINLLALMLCAGCGSDGRASIEITDGGGAIEIVDTDPGAANTYDGAMAEALRVGKRSGHGARIVLVYVVPNHELGWRVRSRLTAEDIPFPVAVAERQSNQSAFVPVARLIQIDGTAVFSYRDSRGAVREQILGANGDPREFHGPGGLVNTLVHLSLIKRSTKAPSYSIGAFFVSKAPDLDDARLLVTELQTLTSASLVTVRIGRTSWFASSSYPAMNPWASVSPLSDESQFRNDRAIERVCYALTASAVTCAK
jgi:hypothetical protein